ncbi:MAG TPA: glucose-1-phosphate cytidylyltransferase [Opitutaceae bacterium]
MKVAILAGGLGSRLSEETVVKPKPMVEIGGRPILWHIMMHYSSYGFKEFVIALGYRGEYIKRYMAEFCSLSSDLHIDLRSGTVQPRQRVTQDWVVDLVDTGMNTQTGGRIKRLRRLLDGETFLATYGDGVSTVDLPALLKFHRRHGRLATVTAVRPPARFGRLDLDGDQVARFAEKPVLDQGWINGAFFVLEPGVFDYIGGDDTNFEAGVLEQLARDGQLMAYRHEGYWQCMDTLRDKLHLEKLWESGNAPWKRWE